MLYAFALSGIYTVPGRQLRGTSTLLYANAAIFSATGTLLTGPATKQIWQLRAMLPDELFDP